MAPSPSSSASTGRHPAMVLAPADPQAITAVEASGLGSAAWAWETGNPSPYPGDLVNPPWTGGPSSLTSYGQTLAQFIATGHPAPIAGNAQLYIAPGQSIDLAGPLLALETPGLPGQLARPHRSRHERRHGTATLTGGDLSYAAPASGSTDVFTYTVSNQLEETATGRRQCLAQSQSKYECQPRPHRPGKHRAWRQRR